MSVHLCLFESKESDEVETDEENIFLNSDRATELKSLNCDLLNNQKNGKGPNINLKYFKKVYDTEKEKEYITKKIKTKKKTELCKNWEVFQDCFFKNECSFAHGTEELINNIYVKGSKNKLCKTFQEKGFCLFGKRCNYRHVITEKTLFTYDSVLHRTFEELYNELNKKENKKCSIIKIYKRILLKRQIIM